MKTICWLTPDSFVDVDKPIILGLLKYYNIQWIIVLSISGGRYRESDFEGMRVLYANLEIDFVFLHTIRDIRTIADYITIRKKILQVKSDLIYLDYPPSIPHILPVYFALPKYKTIKSAKYRQILWLIEKKIVLLQNKKGIDSKNRSLFD